MAAGDLTIGIPGGGASNFATTPIPSLAIDRFPPDAGIPIRGELGYAALSGRSTNGIPQIIGVTHTPKYLWTITAMLTDAQSRQLGALAKWQDATYKSGSDGKLRLIDEITYLDSEASPHSRTLLSSLQESWNSGYVYGFGVFDVLIQLPQDWKTAIGVWGDGSEARSVTFSLVEL